MTKVDSQTLSAWRRAPAREVDLIVRVEGSLVERALELENQGIQVRRRLRLTSSVAIRCAGRVAVKLAKISWITRIEPDKTVRAIGKP